MKKKSIINNNFNIKEIHNTLNYWVNLYYICECTYAKTIISFLLIILMGVIFKIGKELWKAIRYSLN